MSFWVTQTRATWVLELWPRLALLKFYGLWTFFPGWHAVLAANESRNMHFTYNESFEVNARLWRSIVVIKDFLCQLWDIMSCKYQKNRNKAEIYVEYEKFIWNTIARTPTRLENIAFKLISTHPNQEWVDSAQITESSKSNGSLQSPLAQVKPRFSQASPLHFGANYLHNSLQRCRNFYICIVEISKTI